MFTSVQGEGHDWEELARSRLATSVHSPSILLNVKNSSNIACASFRLRYRIAGGHRIAGGPHIFYTYKFTWSMYVQIEYTS